MSLDAGAGRLPTFVGIIAVALAFASARHTPPIRSGSG
jgi:hypothetical protein